MSKRELQIACVTLIGICVVFYYIVFSIIPYIKSCFRVLIERRTAWQKIKNKKLSRVDLVEKVNSFQTEPQINNPEILRRSQDIQEDQRKFVLKKPKTNQVPSSSNSSKLSSDSDIVLNPNSEVIPAKPPQVLRRRKTAQKNVGKDDNRKSGEIYQTAPGSGEDNVDERDGRGSIPKHNPWRIYATTNTYTSPPDTLLVPSTTAQQDTNLEDTRRLIREQDEEYHLTLERDRERLQRRAEELEIEQRSIQLEEEKTNEMSREAVALATRRKELSQTLPPEPDPNDEQGVITIQFQYKYSDLLETATISNDENLSSNNDNSSSSGRHNDINTRIKRRFKIQDPFDVLFDFVESVFLDTILTKYEKLPRIIGPDAIRVYRAYPGTELIPKGKYSGKSFLEAGFLRAENLRIELV